jgi:hypothetical protein
VEPRAALAQVLLLEPKAALALGQPVGRKAALALVRRPVARGRATKASARHCSQCSLLAGLPIANGKDVLLDDLSIRVATIVRDFHSNHLWRHSCCSLGFSVMSKH